MVGCRLFAARRDTLFSRPGLHQPDDGTHLTVLTCCSLYQWNHAHMKLHYSVLDLDHRLEQAAAAAEFSRVGPASISCALPTAHQRTIKTKQRHPRLHFGTIRQRVTQYLEPVLWAGI